MHKSYVPKLEPRAFGPADDDPMGNWGTIEGGMQLSLRFEEEVFQKGEAVAAIVLIRNVTNTAVSYHEPFDLGEHSSICDFIVINETSRETLEGRRKKRAFGTHRGSQLLPSRQDLFVVRLDEIFDFNPGTYSVQALRTNGFDRVPLLSGIAHITVVESNAPAIVQTNSVPR